MRTDGVNGDVGVELARWLHIAVDDRRLPDCRLAQQHQLEEQRRRLY